MLSVPRRIKRVMEKLGASKRQVRAEQLDEIDDQDEADAVGVDLSWMED